VYIQFTLQTCTWPRVAGIWWYSGASLQWSPIWDQYVWPLYTGGWLFVHD